jgi:hypothetical protein
MTLEVVKGQGHNLWSGWFQTQALVGFVFTKAIADTCKIGESSPSYERIP